MTIEEMQEYRRFALLAAAAMLMSSPHFEGGCEEAVSDARELLREIDKQEA